MHRARWLRQHRAMRSKFIQHDSERAAVGGRTFRQSAPLSARRNEGRSPLWSTLDRWLWSTLGHLGPLWAGVGRNRPQKNQTLLNPETPPWRTDVLYTVDADRNCGATCGLLRRRLDTPEGAFRQPAFLAGQPDAAPAVLANRADRR